MRWHWICAIVVTNPPSPDLYLKCPTCQNKISYLLQRNICSSHHTMVHRTFKYWEYIKLITPRESLCTFWEFCESVIFFKASITITNWHQDLRGGLLHLNLNTSKRVVPSLLPGGELKSFLKMESSFGLRASYYISCKSLGYLSLLAFLSLVQIRGSGFLLYLLLIFGVSIFAFLFYLLYIFGV